MLSGSGKPFMKLINLRKLADIYPADFNLLKDKWKIALFSKQVHGYFDAQLKKKGSGDETTQRQLTSHAL